MNSGATLNQRLRVLRKRVGLTQEELAHLIGVHETTIRRWEKGQQQPRVEEIRKLSQALQVSEDELLNGQSYENACWVLQVKIAQDFKEEVIDMTKSIPRDASIITKPKGGYLCLGGDYSLWTDDNNFKKFLADIKKFRAKVIQNGVAFGSIKQ